ncbi:LexA family protein [Microbulbifer sp. TYP-18]|uniref:LexA family protein n=1 Tax=Microbulbifer sp. TYP-18 TaxID=3230024 RepID=UPI0034C6CFA8
MTPPKSQLSVDNIDQLILDQPLCNTQLMVDTTQIRKEFVRRLTEALADKGVKKNFGVTIHEELKRRGAKATTQAINKWLNCESMPARANMQILADWLGVQPSWLQFGEAPKRESHGVRESSSTYYTNVAPGPKDITLVPLISWVQAGEFCEAIDPYLAGDAEALMPCPVPHSRRTYALHVRGDSMTSPYPGQRSYPEGAIIYVDPEIEVTNGSRVIAKIDGEVTFKTYIEDAGKTYLKAINPSYPTLDVTGQKLHICGVIIGYYMPG